MAFARLSSQNFNPGQHRVLLVDRMGVLADLYAISRIAFVGGTLQPLGGHNPLEPAIQGVPVLVGPHHEHFAADVTGLVERGGCEVVTDAPTLQNAVLQAFAHPEAALERGRWAREAAFLYRGATQRTMELLEKLLLIRRWADENQTWRQESLRSERAKPKADAEEYMLDEHFR
jgi:3-deoxy-D-manno-octulosonic-acid transferase